MGFSADSGYVPVSIDDIMTSVMDGINTQFGTSYTLETFVGTNFYKYFYAIAQRIQTNEVKASEVFLKLQDYFKFTNETILNPKVTPNGIIDALLAAGYEASVKPMIDADAGKCSICVNVDSGAGGYAATKLAINTLIKDLVVAGVVTQGSESSTLTLTNGQSFAFKYSLPDTTRTYLKLTVTLSNNNQGVVGTPEDQKQALLANIAAQYGLGHDFEPERYFTIADAPWASNIKLEYSDDNSTWLTAVYEADFDELFTFDLADVTLIED
jgi:hypothetical protein